MTAKPIKMLLFLFAFLGTTTSFAQILHCTGQETSGTTLNIDYNSDPQAQTLKVNGVTHQIQAPTKDRSGVATENFATDKNVVVYDSFIKDGSGKFRLHRFNAMTDETIFDIPVSCKVANQ